MIHDHIDNLGRYDLPYKKEIKAFLESRDMAQVPDGEHAIKGDELFVRVMTHEPKPAAEKQFETHVIYADLQFVASGVEIMQTAPGDRLVPTMDHDAGRDIRFYDAKSDISTFVVRPSEFAVFFPGEAHRPACLYQPHPGPVKKLVFKIKV